MQAGVTYTPEDISYKEMQVIDMIESIKNELEIKNVKKAKRSLNG